MENTGWRPNLTSLSPHAGSGNQTFTAVYSDTGGWRNLTHVYFLINTDLLVNGACHLDIDVFNKTVSLMNDLGTKWSIPVAVGSQAQLTNSRCSLNVAASSMSGSGNDLTVNFALTFQPSFTGRKRIYLRAVDGQDLVADWLPYGAWQPNSSTPSLITRYRLYHPGILAHLYTTDFNEYTVLGSRGWIQEGADSSVYDAPYQNGTDLVPFDRLYFGQNYHHFWTTDRNEYLTLMNYRGIITGEGADAFLSGSMIPGTLPLYRLLWNGPGPIHHWTTDAHEHSVLTAPGGGWTSEGIPGYIFPPGKPPSPSPTAFHAEYGAPRPRRPSVPTLTAITDSVRYRPGVAAPGQPVSLFGYFPGQDEIRVLVDDREAEVVHRSETELRILAPASGRSTRLPVTVISGSTRTAPLDLELVDANPAIIATDPFGRGQAEATNEDGSANSKDKPAPPGSVVSVQVTSLADHTAEAWIGGSSEPVLSQTTAAGRTTLKIRIPDHLPSGATALRIKAGEAFSQSGVSVAVR